MKGFYCSTCFECYYIHPQELVPVCRCTAPIHQYTPKQSSTPTYSHQHQCTSTHRNRAVHLHTVTSTNTPVHTETEQYTYIQSPAPGDKCNSIRNMLSNKKLPQSDIKLVQFIQLVRFKVRAAVLPATKAFCDVTPCRWVDSRRRFEWSKCLHLQGNVVYIFLDCLIWRWRRFTPRHAATSHTIWICRNFECCADFLPNTLQMLYVGRWNCCAQITGRVNFHAVITRGLCQTFS